MRISFLMVLLSLIVLSAIDLFAYIPSSKMILDKLIENNTTGPIYYEQEILLNGNGQSASLKETWLVENDSQMTVLVQGEKDLKDKIQFSIQYNGKRRNSSIQFIKSNDNLSSDFLEPIFFIKSQQKLIPFIVNSGAVVSEVQDSSNFQKQKDVFVHAPESFVRLGRVGGVVAYILNPGLWIEQDQFVLRKIRTAMKTEMSVEKWGNYSRGWKLPKERTYNWSGKTATIKIIDAKIPQINMKSIIMKASEIKTLEYDNSKEKTLIEEFYLRLR